MEDVGGVRVSALQVHRGQEVAADHGITAAGGAGLQLAEWMVEGEPGIDMLGVDPRRFGDYATRAYLVKKNEEAYANVFTVHYPDEGRPAARPLRTAPCHDRLKALGGVFGQKFGWERANRFAPEGVEAVDDWSFRRSRWFEPVGRECRNVAAHVGVLDMSAFAKCRVSGPGAESFPDRLVTLEVHDATDADPLATTRCSRAGSSSGGRPAATMGSGWRSPWRWRWSGRTSPGSARSWRSTSSGPCTAPRSSMSHPTIRGTRSCGGRGGRAARQDYQLLMVSSRLSQSSVNLDL